MVRLPEISDYSSKDLDFAAHKSSAISRYLSLIRSNPVTFADQLRIKRHRAWTLCALATLLNSASAEDICLYWSLITDKIVSSAWSNFAAQDSQLACFALGKWGANELNLSSDIDLIFVSSSSPNTEDFDLVRKFIRTLSENSNFGFCYRIDTDLKPGGRMAPLISSLSQLENYYWSLGATWERLALVRLRFICGNIQVAKDTIAICKKFVYRRFVDFTLVSDLKNLRSQIHTFYKQTDPNIFNLKLAPGAIRDIELFVHALQVIHGGRIDALQTTSTSKAIHSLEKFKFFDSKDLIFLLTTYWSYRQIENIVQSFDDLQTHNWQKSFDQNIFIKLNKDAFAINRIVEHVTGKIDSTSVWPVDVNTRNQWLSDLGFSTPSISQKVPELLDMTVASAKTFKDDNLRLKVIHDFLFQLSKNALDKDLGLALFIDFMRATKAKVSFLYLLAQEERFIHDLSFLFGCSPYLGGIIASKPELLDNYFYGQYSSPKENLDPEYITAKFSDIKLITEISVAASFLKTKDLSKLNENLSQCADNICRELLKYVKNEFSETQIDILCLGKWGGNELGLRSDLDFVFTCTRTPTEVDHKSARRFLSKLTEHSRGGAIYNYDMRLKPSGKGGPLLIEKKSLITYLLNDAEIWERQAYLKSRPLNEVNFLKDIQSACINKKISGADRESLQHIRNKLLDARSTVDFKYSAGGLIDIEFSSQIELLNLQLIPASPHTVDMINTLCLYSEQWKKYGKKILDNYIFLRIFEQLSQIATQHSGSIVDFLSDSFLRTAYLLNAAPEKIKSELINILDENIEMLKSLDLRLQRK